MSAQPEGTLRLSDAARQCGVPVDVLKRLIETGHVKGVVRGPTGHVYLQEQELPTWEDIVEVLEHRLQFYVARATKSLARVRSDVDAVELDLREVGEHPLDGLGFDASAFSVMPSSRGDRSFGAALRQLESDLWDVRLFAEALKSAHRVP